MRKDVVDYLDEAAIWLYRRIARLVGLVMIVIGMVIVAAVMVVWLLLELGFRVGGMEGR